MSDNKFLSAIGIVAVLGVIALIFKSINERTETKLYSDDALKDLKDKNTSKNIDNAISKYHKNGDWDNSLLR